jgi:hypothetical protein
MWTAVPANASAHNKPVLVLSDVVSVEIVQAVGIFAPFTMTGKCTLGSGIG